MSEHVEPRPSVLSAGEALEFLVEASDALSRSLDYLETLRQVARLAVPRLADWAGVYLLGEQEGASEITSGHADPELEQVLIDIRRARRVAAGTSESVRVALGEQPILATDVTDATESLLDDERRRLVARLAPKSYMIVPLLARGRSLGSMTLLSTTEGRHYVAEDLAFAQALAGRCALAIDNARLHDQAERSLSLLDTVFATAPIGLAFIDPDLRFVRVNATMAGFNHRPIEDHLGRTVSDVLGPQADELVMLCRQVLETGRAVVNYEISGPALAPPHEDRHFNASYTPVHGPAGELLGISAVVADVTERRLLLEAEREGRRRADFLVRAGELLDRSLDYQDTLRAVADIAVPEVADWCSVSLLTDDRAGFEQVVTAHVDPAQRRLADEINRRYPPSPGDQGGIVEVARTGETQFVAEITDDMLEAGIDDPERLALVRRLRLRSLIIAALQARGRTLGTLTLANAESGRRFDEADVQLAEELARRAGIAIDNARLYTERTRIAHTLQVKLLPERLPDIPNAVVAARYRAAGELNEVGGDFYDVFGRSDDEWAMVVGDVSGKGAEAAAVTALARYTLRAAAKHQPRPELALQRLNAEMLTHDDLPQFATAVLAYMSTLPGPRLAVQLSLAGHPPPLIARRDGTVEACGVFGSMLGLRPDPGLHHAETVLEPGDVLLFYTDGVTEAGSRSAPLGDAGLRRILGGLAGRTPAEVVDAVEQAVVDAQDGEPRDDIALLAVAPLGGGVDGQPDPAS